MYVTKKDGRREAVDRSKIAIAVRRAARELSDIDEDLIVDQAYIQLYDGMPTADIDRATVMAARSQIVAEPNYSYLAARLLLNSLYREAFGHPVKDDVLDADYRHRFVTNIIAMTDVDRLSKKLVTEFDLDRLARALRPERDRLFKYLGAQTLYDRYLQHINGRRLETPQAFWMRVAMGVSLNESDPTAAAIEAYELFSTLRYCPATPTLFNAGTVRSQLSSCYLSTMEDSIDGIYGTLHGQARLSKYAGGLGIDITPLRAAGSHIKGTNGDSQGYIPWAKQFNTLVCAVNQGGKRKGAAALYSEVWHADFPDFLELRKNTGDERRRCHDLNTANWVCDLFMKQVEADSDWFLFSPDETPDLHELWGDAFERAYWGYVEQGKAGRLRVFNKVRARDLWKKMLVALKETGHPWMTFKDVANERYANQHAGVIHSSNLCTEIFEHTKPSTYDEYGAVLELGETAVCNLGSVNLAAHADEHGQIDYDLLSDTVELAVRILDNVVDLNYYPTLEAQNSNLKYRPVGLGLMGWADVLHRQGKAFDSDWAVQFADRIHEHISYYAIASSADLAAERGAYPAYDGSLWSQGKLPIDTFRERRARRLEPGESFGIHSRLEWRAIRERVARHGMRNGLLMAIAPTATISYIVGCSQSIEPDYAALFAYSTLSGDFTMINEHFVREMKARGLWTPKMVAALQWADGDVARVAQVPADLKEQYKTAFDIDQKKLVDVAAARQKWIDQGQSLNLYYAGDSMRGLHELYMHAWRSDLKSTYYLRTRAASRVEKAAVEAEAPKTCKVGEPCESCQ